MDGRIEKSRTNTNNRKHISYHIYQKHILIINKDTYIINNTKEKTLSNEMSHSEQFL